VVFFYSVRLGTCIALELAVVAGALGGVCVGVGHAIELAGDYFTTREASAATYETNASEYPSRLPGGSLAVPPPALIAGPKTVFGLDDDVLLAPLGAAPLTRIKPNLGGTSLSLRVDFANGARASFKPEQIHPQSDPRREVAAYRMDRLLEIGHVPPSKPIKFTVAELLAATDPSKRTQMAARFTDEARAKNGELRGMVYWWIPEIRDFWLDGVEGHDPAAMQQLMSYMQIGAEVPAKHAALIDQFATLIVFDALIDNADRWSGSNTKVSPDYKTLYFMDNSLSFSRFPKGHESNLKMLQRMQVFPRGLIKRLRELTHDKITAALDLGDDPAGLGPLLTPEETRALIARRDRVIEHIDQLIAQHGEDAVLSLP
jgi:hypothetical protein